MAARIPRPIPLRATDKYAALVSIDPASTTACGLTVRFTGALAEKPERGRLRLPDFTYEGSVWNTRMHDDLALALARAIPRGARVALVAEDTIFGNRKIARGIGRAIGCLDGILADLNYYDPTKDLYYATGSAWRKHAFPLDKADDRDGWKALAVATVASLYGLDCGDDLAEAILISDYAVLAKQTWWRAKSRKRAA